MRRDLIRPPAERRIDLEPHFGHRPGVVIALQQIGAGIERDGMLFRRFDAFADDLRLKVVDDADDFRQHPPPFALR